MMLHLDNDTGNHFNGAEWRERLQIEKQRRQQILAREAVADDARKIVSVDFDVLAILASVEQDFRGAAVVALEAAAMAAAAVLSTRFDNALTNVTLPGGVNLRIPGGGLPLPPFDWLKAVACALIDRDQVALPILCAPPSIAAAQRPRTQADDFWPFLCAATAAAIQAPATAEGWLAQVESLITPGNTFIAKPEMVSLQIAPLIPLLRALCGKGDWPAALAAAISSHTDFFSRVDRSANPQRLLSLVLCGLCALACDRGLTKDAPGLPQPLVRGDFERACCNLTLELPPCFPAFPDNPTTWLDLMHVPSDQRSHTLVQSGDDLLERHLLPAAGGEPAMQVDFIVPHEGEKPNTRKVALDAGERALAADLYARSTDPRSLTRALEQLDRVLATIPAGTDSVRPEAFTNPAGIAERDADPGRFRHDRLQAYRHSLRTQLADLQADLSVPPRPQTTSELESYKRAIAAAEVIKKSVEPLLRQLAGPQASTTIASVRPRPGDYELVFEPGIVNQARAVYEKLWAAGSAGDPAGPEIDSPSTSQSVIKVFAAPAGLLRGENELSRDFPGGYLQIALLLKPERVWIAWKFVAPDQSSGLAFDGLAWCDDHWAWFPKPYRFLRLAPV
jgi:hypothetical protein